MHPAVKPVLKVLDWLSSKSEQGKQLRSHFTKLTMFLILMLASFVLFPIFLIIAMFIQTGDINPQMQQMYSKASLQIQQEHQISVPWWEAMALDMAAYGNAEKITDEIALQTTRSFLMCAEAAPCQLVTWEQALQERINAGLLGTDPNHHRLLKQKIEQTLKMIEELHLKDLPEGWKPVIHNLNWPVDPSLSIISSPFGNRLHPILKTIRLHAGIDIAVVTGTPVYAIADGVIEQSEYDAQAGYFIKMNHGQMKSRYLHLSKLLVKSGESVQKGQLIGHSGNTGASDGAHLHFELLDQTEKAVNPIKYYQ
jgi:predicted transcriptional regulator